MNNPHIIQFKRIGKPSEGYLSIVKSNEDIILNIKKIY